MARASISAKNLRRVGPMGLALVGLIASSLARADVALHAEVVRPAPRRPA